MLIEDHPEYREVIKYALASEPGMELINMFGAAEVALRNFQDTSTRKQIDLILLDINLPGMSGIEALPWFKKYSPATRTIMLTQSNMEADVVKAIQAGAAGYILKSSSIENLVIGIKSAMSGGASLDASVATYIIKALQRKKSDPQITIELTKRESEILVMLGEGLQKKEISEKLDIGVHTVAEYVKRIYIKLEVKNAPAAVNRAYKLGLFPEEK